LAVICSGAFLVWLFRLHGTRGLLHVEIIGWLAVVFVAALGILPLAFWFIHYLGGKKSRLLTAAVIVLSVVSIVVPVFGYAYTSGFPSPTPISTEPRLILAGTGSNSLPDAAITFMSSKPTRASLAWGRDKFTNTIEETEAVTNHIFILSDLAPGSRYMYRADGGTTYYFTTPGTRQPLHFAVGSDAHFGAGDNRPDITAQMLGRIAAPGNKYDYFFFLGDLVEFGFRPEEWQPALAALPAASGTVPTAFAPGNHDCLFTGLNRYLAYCSPEGLAGNSGARLWRRIDIGDIHFLVLDLEWSAEAFTPQQQAWLETELKSIPPEDWTVVMNHGYYYASGSSSRGWQWWDNRETINLITPLFEKYDVDLVFSGHAHQMELLEQNGVAYVIAGAFGGIPDPEREYVSPSSLWYASGEYGYVDVSIDADQVQIVFRDQYNQILHSAVITK
jgi:UDP-2,3-diacylglucosamine pyrophosphatase LpxH